jgi:hypothetical protein
MSFRYYCLACVLFAAAGWLVSTTAAQDEKAPAKEEAPEVLARGPVHEAFAELIETRPQPAPVVGKQPPDPIEETPPDQKPEGDNVQWIPGYWSWDEDQKDYLWVSGFWREPPPGRQWVPGNWQEVDGGWQWTPGYWAAANQDQLTYVPLPPPSLDSGPSTPAPDANSIYVPGCWIHRTRFVWRPGFWIAYRPNWVWIPAHYVWTAGGCLFVEGYWDHPLEERGLLFAPVRLTRGLLARRGWSFEPRYVVQPDFLITALFARPVSHCYYFGDYFQARYRQRGFVDWLSYRTGRASVDPNFGYYQRRFAGDKRWERKLDDLYTARQQGDIALPPRTLVQQAEIVNKITGDKTAQVAVTKNIEVTNIQNVSVLAPLKQVHNLKVTHLADPGKGKGAVEPHVIKLEAVSKERRADAQKAVKQFHALAEQRRQGEGKLISQGTAPVKHTDTPRPVKVEMPKAQPQKSEPKSGAKKPPPLPPAPKHEEKAIPKHDPPKPPQPPKNKDKDMKDKDKKPPPKKDKPKDKPS